MRTCQSFAEFSELSASIPNMSLVYGSHDDQQQHSPESRTCSLTAKQLHSDTDRPVSSHDSDIIDLDSDTRKSGDFHSYTFLLRVLPVSATIIYIVSLLLTAVVERFLG